MFVSKTPVFLPDNTYAWLGKQRFIAKCGDFRFLFSRVFLLPDKKANRVYPE